MINILKVSAFIVIVVVAIAGFASMIPQLDSPAPEALEITGDLSGEDLAAMGQTVFDSPEAGCTACHALGREGLRGPDLANIGAMAAERVPGESAEVYLRKAVVEPCAHVTEGYDCIMPPTLLQTLGEAKVTALVAYMQSLGGEVTVRYTGEQAVSGASSNPGGTGAPGSAGVAGATAEEILTNAGCSGCHAVQPGGANPGVGPDLSIAGARMTPEEIRQAVLGPDAVIAAEGCAGACQGGIMPKDYGQRLTAAQMETLVTYLSGLK